MIELSVAAARSMLWRCCYHEAFVVVVNPIIWVGRQDCPKLLVLITDGFATIIADGHDDSLFSFDLPITEYVVADYDSFELSQSTFGYHANEP
jgi:hypothetical protein